MKRRIITVKFYINQPSFHMKTMFILKDNNAVKSGRKFQNWASQYYVEWFSKQIIFFLLNI